MSDDGAETLIEADRYLGLARTLLTTPSDSGALEEVRAVLAESSSSADLPLVSSAREGLDLLPRSSDPRGLIAVMQARAARAGPLSASPSNVPDLAQAIAALVAHHPEAAPPDPAALPSLLAQPPTAQNALARTIDAFVRMEDAARRGEDAIVLGAQADLVAAALDLVAAPRFRSPAAADVCLVPGVLCVDATGVDSTYTDDTSLIIDVGGDDVYQNNAGGSNVAGTPRGAAALLDLAGNDQYGDGTRSGGLNGGAFTGVGFLFDLAGNDVYNAGNDGVNGGGLQGGLGTLLDTAGDDLYIAGSRGANGGGDFGDGLLIDLAGHDRYTAGDDGTNGGAQTGVGRLIDLAGDDEYIAGSRGTNGGGNVGTGMLLDLGGRDAYVAGGQATNGGGWTQGIGILLDRNGDDRFTAGNVATNGGGVTGGIGILIDRSGSDRYSAGDDAVNGGAHGGVGVLFDRNGDDAFTALGATATNGAGVTGPGLLLDGDGFDVFRESTAAACDDNVNPCSGITPKGTGAQVNLKQTLQGLGLADVQVPSLPEAPVRPGRPAETFDVIITTVVPARITMTDDRGEPVALDGGVQGTNIYWTNGDAVTVHAAYTPVRLDQIGDRTFRVTATDVATGDEVFQTKEVQGTLKVLRDLVEIVPDATSLSFFPFDEPLSVGAVVTSGYFADQPITLVVSATDAASTEEGGPAGPRVRTFEVVPNPGGVHVTGDFTPSDDDAFPYGADAVYTTALQTAATEVFEASSAPGPSVQAKRLPPPTADFTAETLIPTAPDLYRVHADIRFTSTSTGGDGRGITATEWDFDDGDTSPLAAPRHAFADVIDRRVRLVVHQGDGQTAAAEKELHIVPAPPATLRFVTEFPFITYGGSEFTIIVEALDAFGNVATEDPISVTLSKNTGPGVLTPLTIAESTVAGRATFMTPHLDLIGDYTLKAAAPSIPDAFSGTVTVDPGRPTDHIVIMPSEATIKSGSSLTFTARAEDAFGDAAYDQSFAWQSDQGGILAVDPVSGTATAGLVGFANVTATHSSGKSATAMARVVTEPSLTTRITVLPRDPVVQAGTAARFTAQGFDAAGNDVGPITATFSLNDPRIGSLTSNGSFSGRQAGVAAVTGAFNGATNATSVRVIPGPPAFLRIVPSGAALEREGSVTFRAEGFDVRNNPTAIGAVEWAIDDAGLGSIGRATGTFQAYNNNGTVRITATADDAVGLAVVQITGVRVEAEKTAAVTAETTSQTVDNITTTSYQVAVADAAVNSSLAITPKTVGNATLVQSMHARIGSVTSNFALVVETQGGGLDVVPTEVNITTLAGIVASKGPAAQVPLYLNVQASESGTMMNSTRLNEVLANMTVHFRLPASTFNGTGLSPRLVLLVEYHDGVIVQTGIPTTLVTYSPRDGFYEYSAELDRFSSFAVIALPVPSIVPGSVGGGGGAQSIPTVSCSSGEVVVNPADAFVARVALTSEDGRCGLGLSTRLVQVLGADARPAEAPVLPAGFQPSRFVDVDPRIGDLKVSRARIDLSLARPASGPDPKSAIVLHLLGGVWQIEGHMQLVEKDGRLTGSLAMRCCSLFSVGFDVQAPSIVLAEISSTVTGPARLAAAAVDNLQLDRVEFFVDGVLAHTDREAPYEFGFDSRELSNGVHAAEAAAVDGAGNRASSTLQFTTFNLDVIGGGLAGDSPPTATTVYGTWPQAIGLGVLVGLYVIGSFAAERIVLRRRRRSDGTAPTSDVSAAPEGHADGVTRPVREDGRNL